MPARIVLVSLLFTACGASTRIDTRAQVACGSASDCPAPLVCVRDLGRCSDPTNTCIGQSADGYASAPSGNACTTSEIGAGGICLRGACVVSACGDGYTDTSRGEECDTLDARSDSAADACRSNCMLARCGDGVRDGGEACDDGNRAGGDGCARDCQRVEACGAVTLEGARQAAAIDEGETCDDDNDEPNDGCDRCQRTAWRSEILIGALEGSAVARALNASELAVMPDGSVLAVELSGSITRVFRVDPAQRTVVPFAGNGQEGSPADGALAVESPLPTPAADFYGGGGSTVTVYRPAKIAAARDGNVYLSFMSTVWRIDTNGRIQHFAGSGTSCYDVACGDGGKAIAAGLSKPNGLAVDREGRVYISDRDAHRVRRVDRQGLITTVAGSSSSCTPGTATCGDGSAATAAQLNQPAGLALAPSGELYIADGEDRRIRRVSTGASPKISTVVGTGVECSAPCADAGAGPSLAISSPRQLVFIDGALYFTDARSGPKLLRYDPISQVVGPVSTALSQVSGIAARSADTIYLSHDLVLDRLSAGSLQRIAGTGADLPEADGLYAWSAPGGVSSAFYSAVAATGPHEIVFWEAHWGRLVRLDTSTGLMSAVAGADKSCASTQPCGDGGPAKDAGISGMDQLASGTGGALYFADRSLDRVRRIASDGSISTIAGTGQSCLGGASACGDGGPALSASFELDGAGIALAPNGDIFVSEPNRQRIRKIDAATQVVSTYAGTGEVCATVSCGDGGLATAATFTLASRLAVDSSGDLYLTDVDRVRKITKADGKIVTETSGFTYASALALAKNGDLLVADAGAYRVVRSRAGINTPVAGTGVQCSAGADACRNGFLATSAALVDPRALVEMADGTIVVSDRSSLRKIAPSGRIDVLATASHPPSGAFSASRLVQTQAMARLGAQTLLADGSSGRLLRADMATRELLPVLGYTTNVPAWGPFAAYSRLLGNAFGLAVDEAAARVYASDAESGSIGVIDASDPSPFAWTTSIFLGADAPRFAAAAGLAWDALSARLYVTDIGAHALRVVQEGEVRTLAGTDGWAGDVGDKGAAANALLRAPSAVALGRDGSIYLADTGNHRVRRIDPTGTIDTVLGDGTAGRSLGTGASRGLGFASPAGLAVDSRGNLFVAGSGLVRVVLAGPDGIPSGDDLSLLLFGGDTSGFAERLSACLSGIVLYEEDGRVVVADRCVGMLIALTRTRETPTR